ncbi:hypothetical protein [Tardiphaga sp. 709]|uniref:hypothetical protein n=1 Tax=Tardiphaga sp. 709 TaxID=3076039 RepID=UPI0028F07483|nr:hypothetical protein [Tardiphaga sp. 709]WNV09985.1 hypothetical protein RSO67_01950 [Tardiphaga sp. 709]
MTKAATHHSNDNEELPFKSIGLASMLILNKLRLATQLEVTEQEKDETEDAGRSHESGRTGYEGSDARRTNRFAKGIK